MKTPLVKAFNLKLYSAMSSQLIGVYKSWTLFQLNEFFQARLIWKVAHTNFENLTRFSYQDIFIVYDVEYQIIPFF